MELPSVSILTPVYDRNKFLNLMILNMELINYPKDKLEWVILDSWSRDGIVGEKLFESDENISFYSKKIGIKIKYVYRPEAMSIGRKRNMLVKLSSNNIVINMDSDDIYLPNYIQYSVKTLVEHKKECVGSPQMLFVYPKDDYKMTYIRCEKMRMAHEATMCMTKKHWKRMGGYANTSQGEGCKIVDGCSEKLFEQTDIRHIMICVCGDHNTIDKSQFNTDRNFLKDTTIKDIPHFNILKDIFDN
tara:strand:+ start:655 stop:1389 length:735 start_codon:yes stop_codon:yes gene_type:complete